jgi:hypothetical protein
VGRLGLACLIALGAAIAPSSPARADAPPPPPSTPSALPPPLAPLAPPASPLPVLVPAKVALPAPLGRRAPTPDPALQRPPGWKWTGMLDITSASSFLWFAGGALSGLTLHEMGHVLTNLAYGNPPHITGILYGKFIPWFVIDPALTEREGVFYKSNGAVFAGGRKGYFVINTAGLQVQNIGSEAILSAHPGLLYEKAPFLKGMLWMNMILSIGYSTASIIGTEDPHGDLFGAGQHSQFPHALTGGIVFANGALDVLRYLIPDTDWLPWLSRTSKVMFFGMDIPFK